MEIKNAKIIDAKLFIEDHDILTFMIHIDAGMFCCGIGGYALDQAAWTGEKFNSDMVRKASPAGLECMRKIMEVVGVTSWEDLPGKYIRYEDNGWGSTVDKIGNIVEDKWIDIREFFATYDYEDWYKKFRNKESLYE